MEVYVRDEDKKWDISYDLANQNNSLDCKDHRALIVKSLDQHDLEIRADERKKVLEWAKQNKNNVGIDIVDYESLKTRLNIKGE